MSDSQKTMYALWDKEKGDWVTTSFVKPIDDRDAISGIRLFFDEAQATVVKYMEYGTCYRGLTVRRYTP